MKKIKWPALNINLQNIKVSLWNTLHRIAKGFQFEPAGERCSASYVAGRPTEEKDELRSFRSPAGFTLLETLIALGITVTAGILVSSSWSGNYMLLKKTTLNNNIAQLLSRKMIEMEAKYKGKKFTEVKDEEGDFGKDFSNYTWTFTTQPFEMPDLTSMLTSKKGGGTDQMLITMMNKMREAVGKAILEVTVTVIVTVSGKPIKHSVTSYFVDYDSEPNLGLTQ